MAVGRHTVYHGLHVKADFQLDRGGIRKIAVGTELRAAVHDIVAVHAKPIAEALAAEFTKTGTYARSFRIDDGTEVTGGEGWPMRRAACRLVNDAKRPNDTESYALIVEVGDARFRGHHVLGRTLDALVALGVVHMKRRRRAGRL